MSVTIEWLLIILLAVLIAAAAVLCVYIAGLIKTASETLKSLKELSELVKTEIAPALKSVNSVLKTADSVSSGVNKLTKAPIALLSAAAGAVMSLKGKGGFLSGLVSGFNLITRKRK